MKNTSNGANNAAVVVVFKFPEPFLSVLEGPQELESNHLVPRVALAA